MSSSVVFSTTSLGFAEEGGWQDQHLLTILLVGFGLLFGLLVCLQLFCCRAKNRRIETDQIGIIENEVSDVNCDE